MRQIEIDSIKAGIDPNDVVEKIDVGRGYIKPLLYIRECDLVPEELLKIKEFCLSEEEKYKLQLSFNSLKSKFTSGNQFPVSRNTITQEEWEPIKNLIEQILSQ